jgi:hypothetical protein
MLRARGVMRSSGSEQVVRLRLRDHGPWALVSWHFVVIGDRKAGAFYLLHVAAGFAVLAFGGLAKFPWERLRVRRTR